MNILIISIFGINFDSRNKKIRQYGFPDDKITLITSNFQHGAKQYIKNNHASDAALGIKRISVPAYKKNLSFQRVFSHIVFSLRLKKILNQLEDKPDLIYCVMPTSSAAVIAGKYCKKHDIPFVIDVIDLWPDSLIPIIRCKKLLNLCMSPWRYLTNSAYRLADYISSESKAYAQVAHKINPKVPFSHTYLGVNINDSRIFINSSRISLKKPDDEIWIGYGGSLGNSYDFNVILSGLETLKSKGIKYKMWFVGGGEKETYIKNYAEQHGLNIEITGRLPYGDLLRYLSYCDIAINTFLEGTLVVHSYKFNDYVAAGCYILNNLPGETSEMIDQYQIGRNFNTQNFSEILLSTIRNWDKISRDIDIHIHNIIEAELDTSIIYRRLGEDIKSRLLS